MTSQYITAEYLQKTLAVTGNVVKLTEIAFDACNCTDKELKKFADEVPLPKGSKFWADATYLATLYAKHLWYAFMYQGMARDAALKAFEGKAKKLREAVRLEPTTRTKFRATRTRFGRQRKVPHSQVAYGGGNLDYIG